MLTYDLAEHTPSLLPKRKHARSKNERHRLELQKQSSGGLVGELDLREVNRQLRRMDFGRGRVISVGGATFRSNF